MTKQERVTFVINTLKELYPTIPIPLDHKDPYTLLIAVLLSAQCTLYFVDRGAALCAMHRRSR